MFYDLLWSLVIFAILLGAVIYYGFSESQPDDHSDESRSKKDDENMK